MTNRELALIATIIVALLMLGFSLAYWWAFRNYGKHKGGNHEH